MNQIKFLNWFRKEPLREGSLLLQKNPHPKRFLEGEGEEEGGALLRNGMMLLPHGAGEGGGVHEG
ncbi:hypothetical protein ACSBR1_011048 [Camellia fascicularis]